MKYIRIIGSKWIQVFAIDKSAPKCSLIELRYKDATNETLDGIILDCYSSILGNYDVNVVESLLQTGESLTQQDWGKYRKIVQAYINQMNE